MPPRKPRTLTPEDVFHDVPPAQQTQNFPVAPPIPSPEEEIEEDEVTALNNILSEIGGRSSGGGYVNVFREITHAGGKLDRPYLGQMQAGDFVNGGFIEALKQQYGAGKYDLCVYVTGHRGVYDRKKITIADDRTASPAGQPGGVNTHAIVDAINQGNERTLQAILALAQQKPQQPDLMGQLQMFKMMRDIFAPSGPSAGPMDALAAIKLGAELAGKGGNIDDSDGGWASKMIDTFGKPIVEMVMGGGGVIPGNSAMMPRATGTPPQLPVGLTPPSTTIPQPVNTENTNVNPMISFYLNLLKSKAVKNEPVEPVADDILSRLSPVEAGELRDILQPETWRETIRRHTPAIDQHPDWFGRLRDVLLKYIAEDAAQPIPGLAGGLTVIPAAGISVNHDNHTTLATSPETPGQGIPGGAS